MHSPDPTTATQEHDPRTRRRWFAAIVALLATGVIAGYAFLTSQAGVDFAVRELVRRSGGTLEVEAATGSLLDTMRIRRAAWHGPDASVVAHDVALTWSPAALLSRGVLVRGLGVRALALEFKAAETELTLPTTLALPVEVTVERVGVGQLDWRVGTSRGTMRGIEFGYAGGAMGHRVRDLALVTSVGALSGEASIAADPPFTVTGRLTAQGDATLRGARAEATLAGTLAHTTIEGRGEWGTARVVARASLAPLAIVPLQEVALDVSDLDLAERDAALPATRLEGAIRAQPAAGGFAGTLDVTNGAPRHALRGVRTRSRSTIWWRHCREAAGSPARASFHSIVPVLPESGRSMSAMSTCDRSTRHWWRRDCPAGSPPILTHGGSA
jgi:translocation and assembly module TamB